MPTGEGQLNKTKGLYKIRPERGDKEFIGDLDLLGSPPDDCGIDMDKLKISYLKAKLRKDEALAEQYEYKVLVAKRKLIDPNELLDAYKYEISVLYRALQSIGGSIAPILAGERNVKKIQLTIDKKINSILARLGKAGEEFN